MKIRIEVQEGLAEEEIVIRCTEIGENVQRIHKLLLNQAEGTSGVVFYKGSQEYYFPLSEVLFFETEGEGVYAHTADDSYKIRHRLYELEGMLPAYFARASKSTIINTKRIHSITRNITASSLVEFRGTHKHVYVSRKYYSALKDKLQGRTY